MDIIFFKRLREKSLGYSLSKNSTLMAVVFKSYEIVLIRVFLHAEFISAPKTEIKSMVFEKYAKNGKKKNIYYHYFLFFEIFV